MARWTPDPSFYPSPGQAAAAPPETLAYVATLNTGSNGDRAPDALTVLDLEHGSPTYGQLVGRLDMPGIGDELHHFGWNACSSCHTDTGKSRRFLIVPGFGSSRIHIIDVGDERAPRLHKVIEPQEIREKTNLSAPHTVHCLADGQIMISMLGDGEGNEGGGFLLLDEEFNIAGRWEKGAGQKSVKCQVEPG